MLFPPIAFHDLRRLDDTVSMQSISQSVQTLSQPFCLLLVALGSPDLEQFHWVSSLERKPFYDPVKHLVGAF